jgi:hypothetical protein
MRIRTELQCQGTAGSANRAPILLLVIWISRRETRDEFERSFQNAGRNEIETEPDRTNQR